MTRRELALQLLLQERAGRIALAVREADDGGCDRLVPDEADLAPDCTDADVAVAWEQAGALLAVLGRLEVKP